LRAGRIEELEDEVRELNGEPMHYLDDYIEYNVGINNFAPLPILGEDDAGFKSESNEPEDWDEEAMGDAEYVEYWQEQLVKKQKVCKISTRYTNCTSIYSVVVKKVTK
jgi:hypothetical protein